MSQIIAVANQKGGVGKSTTCANLAACLSECERDRRILLIDLDPQAGLTTSLGCEPEDFPSTIYDAMIDPERTPLEQVRTESRIPHVDLIPANLDLAGAEAELIGEIGWDRTLRDVLRPVLADYDWVIVDCPPSLGVLTTNALMAAHLVIVPVQAEYLAMRGLRQLMQIIEKVRRKGNPELALRVLRTMHDARTLHSTEVNEELARALGPEVVYRAIIKRTIRFADSTLAGEPLALFDPKSEGARSYRELTEEVLTHGRAQATVA